MKTQAYLVLATVIVMTGCVSPVTTSTHRRPVASAFLDVPFIPQKPGYCGPAALAMVARYHGHETTQEDIGAAIYLPEIQGTLTTELAEYARRFQLWVRQYRGSRADLRQKTEAGVPLIVLGRFGSRDHFFVVVHFDRRTRTVTAHSDTRPFLQMSEDDFLRHWSRTGNWTLLVCPPDHVAWRLSAAEHNDLGVFLERNGQFLAAAGHYDAATALAPGNAYYWLNLGNAYLAGKFFHEAAQAYARAVKADPSNADASNNLAWAYHELGANLDEAEQLCRRAVELRPSHRAYYLDTLGSVLVKQGKPGEAIQAFESALAATTDRQAALRKMIEQHLAEARRALSSITPIHSETPATGH